jgi:hypothetical protein
MRSKWRMRRTRKRGDERIRSFLILILILILILLLVLLVLHPPFYHLTFSSRAPPSLGIVTMELFTMSARGCNSQRYGLGYGTVLPPSSFPPPPSPPSLSLPPLCNDRMIHDEPGEAVSTLGL